MVRQFPDAAFELKHAIPLVPNPAPISHYVVAWAGFLNGLCACWAFNVGQRDSVGLGKLAEKLSQTRWGR